MIIGYANGTLWLFISRYKGYLMAVLEIQVSVLSFFSDSSVQAMACSGYNLSGMIHIALYIWQNTDENASCG